MSSLISQTADGLALDAQQALAGGNLHAHLLQFALADLVIEGRAGVHDAAAEGDQRGVLDEDRGGDLRGALHARRPVQLEALGGADDGLDARLLVGAGALEGRPRSGTPRPPRLRR